MAKQTSKSFISIEEINQKLDKGIEDIFKSDRYKEMLQVMSKFRNYSLNNSIMIMIQKPNATMVKGFRQWQELGRNVNKGEKSIKILAPMIRQKDKIDENTKKPVLDGNGKPVKDRFISGFKAVSVFDVEQTNGKEIPSVRDFINRDLQDDNSMKDFYENFTEHIQKEGIYSVSEDVTNDGVGGYFSPKTNEIVVSNSENGNDSEKFRVLVHEYAHAKLHNLEGDFKDVERGHKEAQAESVAYVVSNYYGLETDDVSLGYIATWAQNPSLARQALSEIQDVSGKMIDVLEDIQQEKIHEFYQNNSKIYEQAVESFEDKFNIKLDTLDKKNPDMQFEIIQKDRGNVLSAKVEYSEKTEKFQMRLNNNRIVPLDEFAKDGNYSIINQELHAGNIQPVIANYNNVNDFKVSLMENEQKYGITDSTGELFSDTFDSKELAEKQFERMGISQALHHQSFMNSNGDPTNEDVKDRVEALNLTINHRVSNYLSDNNKEFVPTGDGGTTIGWTIMKRPEIKSIDDLNTYRENTKHLPSNEKLFQSIDNATVSEKENENSKEDLELA